MQIQLDLTSQRARLLKIAKEKATECAEVDFALMDINCPVGINTKGGNFVYFDNELKVKSMLENLA